MKILVYTLLDPGLVQIYPQSRDSILGLRWSEPLQFMFHRSNNQTRPAYEDITEGYQAAQAMVLNDGYDALLTVESDMIVPPYALEHLNQVEADVVYGLYCSRKVHPRWLVATRLDDTTWTSLGDDPETARKAWGKVIPSVGVGFNCTLFHRRVLEEVPFRIVVTPMGPCCDWFFSLDCQAKGYKQATDLTVVCGHIQREPDPKVVWPDPSQPCLYRLNSPDARVWA